MLTPANETYSFHYNAIGSTIAISDKSQNIINKYSYGPFGEVSSQIETVLQPFKFVGQFGVMTEPNGLYYMRARYYDPKVGRFISEDPIGLAGGLNLYLYCSNNPINWVDPYGLFAFGLGIPDPNNPPPSWKPGGDNTWHDPDIGETWHWHPDPEGNHGGDHWDIGGPKGDKGEKGKQDWWPEGGEREPKPGGKDRKDNKEEERNKKSK